MPCGDTVSNNDLQEQVAQESEDHDHEDFCSPFCQCSCCSVSVINYHVDSVDLESIAIASPQHIIFYTNPQYDGFLGSILQPPQLNN